jgi:hypothetical protein
MSHIKVDTVVCSNGSVLIVFYTPGKCWQFRVISSTQGIFGEQKIYGVAESKYESGDRWNKTCTSHRERH